MQVNTTTIYPVSTYGTAMAPFYSTLAIWVGCVVLAIRFLQQLIHIFVDKEEKEV